MRVSRWLLLGLALAACGEPVPVEPADAGVISDAGVTFDAGVTADAGVTFDACVIFDAGVPVDAGVPQVTVENLTDGTELRYRLALIRGTVAAGATSVSVTAASGAVRTWPVSGGKFKALVPLVPGDNALKLGANGIDAAFNLKYRESTNPRFVRMVYVVASDGDGSFDAPAGEPSTQASALDRLRLAAELMQTFTAEKLNAQGLGRQTFRLDRDANGQVKIEVFKSTLTMAQAHAMDGLALWNHFYGELANLPQRNDTIDVAVMAMTRYVPAQQKALAHTALGGGRLGLFGSGTLYSYATSLDQLVSRWSDARNIDTTQLFDDSGLRGTYWANYATGLGATLHELGHCLSLPHPANGIGVMSRQFDFINRAFMVREPASKSSPAIDTVLPAQEAGWDRSAAVRLRFHRWLAPDAKTYGVNVSPAISSNGTTVSVMSAAGVRHVAYLVNGDVATHDEQILTPPMTFSTTVSALKARLPAATTVKVSAIDDDGNIGEADVALP